MSKSWPTVAFGQLMERSSEAIFPGVDQEYREITVRLWGKGVVERSRVAGASLSGRRFVAHSGQFILSRIDARNGAVGLVPEFLDGALVSNDFPLFNLDKEQLQPAFLGWLCRTAGFVDLCVRSSEGTTNRVRLKEEKFHAMKISLPPLAEQKRIVARIDELVRRCDEAREQRQQAEQEIKHMLSGAFRQISADARRRPMREVAPLVRRPVTVDPLGSYSELGIRSFGKGTFHKPTLSGIEIGEKRIFGISPDDLVFSNVFAWEGAIAVARPADVGRVGSHRFMTCVPKPGVATAKFLCFFFLTAEGLDLIGTASPGGAGRNRTLGLAALGEVLVPIPAIEHQKWFDGLQGKVDELRRLQAETAAELDALVPSVLNAAFSDAF